MTDDQGHKPQENAQLSPRDLKQWVVWRYETRDGKDTKVPYDPKQISRRASTTNPDTWSTAAHAAEVRRVRPEMFDGIGFVVTPEDDFVGIDLDHCRDPETETIQPWALQILIKLDSYVEVSPSGTGLRIFVRGEIPEEGPFRLRDTDRFGIEGQLEMYDRGRYFTITGQRIDDTRPGSEINWRQQELDDLREDLWPIPVAEPVAEPVAPATPSTIEDGPTDSELIELARNSAIGDEFQALWDGHTDSYEGDESKCDHHLARMIAFYTGPDPDRIIRIFNESARGQREKWQKREDYRARTVSRVLKNVTEFYTPPQPKPKVATMRHLVAVDPDSPTPVAGGGFIRSAKDLMKQELPEVKWVVQDILPEGVTLFAGKSKIRKSWLCIGLCVSVAAGGVALGRTPVEKGNTLYLALEDNDRRMQRRLSKVLNGEPCPEGFDYATTFPRVDQGGAELLVQWIEANPNARLIVIDTLAKIRPRTRNQGYQEDYEAVEKIMEIANKHQIGVIIVHHTRKAEAEDVVDEINATTGLMGGVDGFLVLKTKRERFEGSMFVTGREIEEERNIALRWDQHIHGWTMIDEEEVSETEEGLSPQRRLILDLLSRAANNTLPVQEIIAHVGASKQAVTNLLRVMVKDGRIEKAGRGLYKLAVHEPDQLTQDELGEEHVVGTTLTPDEFQSLWGKDPNREDWTDAEEEEEPEE